MIRAILDVLILTFFLILSLPGKWLVFLLRKTGHYDAGNKLAKFCAGILFDLLRIASGVKLTVRGEENLTRDEGVLYVGNHCSYFDIVLSFCAFKTCTGYIGKKELGRYPLFNTWMLAIGCIFLDRDNPRDGIRMVNEAVDHIAHKNSMCIFPEGTRNRNEKKQLLGEFHHGSLRIASKAGCKVVPMAISGTAEIFENHIPFIKSTPVIIEFAKPIETADMDRAQLKKLPDMCVEAITKMRLEHIKELQ
ncbi:MAG: 1-acyl-sn-glycerol-3-phosphate acyltransferase [Lachnospiraceae bacterium]|nr:1-acyl-sn-glycerol-3-phosphate acyltransferase [Lachnospiraceae bacterium]